MLSILIPTYNYTIFPLVSKIHELLELEQIPFEIRCLDDASDNPYCQSENEKINNLKNASYKILEKNIGRSKIRNLLGKNAIYDWLLFMDADVYPIQDDFIKNYIKYLKTEPSVVYGGIRYTKEKPPAEELLRWEYGKHREALAAERRKKNPYLSFLTLNFLIHKNILLSVPFNESIPNLRHEDTLFSYDLKTNNIPIYHIENPVYHLGLESSVIFLEKSIDSIKASLYLRNKKLLPDNYIKLNRYSSFLAKYKLNLLVSLLGYVFEKRIKKNLKSNKPSLFLFDFYRLYYFTKYASENTLENN